MGDRRNGDSPAFTLKLVKEGQLRLGTNYTNKNIEPMKSSPWRGEKLGRDKGNPSQQQVPQSAQHPFSLVLTES